MATLTFYEPHEALGAVQTARSERALTSLIELRSNGGAFDPSHARYILNSTYMPAMDSAS